MFLFNVRSAEVSISVILILASVVPGSIVALSLDFIFRDKVRSLGFDSVAAVVNLFLDK